MNKLCLQLIALAAAMLFPAASAPAGTGQTPPLVVEVPEGRAPDAWPVQPVSFPGGVTAYGDIVYDQPLHYRPLRLDLYEPAGEGPHPLVVYVHGGAWMVGTKRQGGPVTDFPAILASLAARGFVVASVEYRLDGEVKFPGTIKDVKTAIRFLRRNATKYGIDPLRVGIWGPSAGGQLAALAGVSCGVKDLEPDVPAIRPGARGPQPPTSEPVSDCVQAAVGWFGVYNFASVPTPPGQPGPSWYLGCPTFTCSKEVMARASPITYVDPSDPPILLIHGDADTLVTPAQTPEFARALRSNGVATEVIIIPAVDHGFVGKTREITRAANVQALTATFEFFDRTLRKSEAQSALSSKNNH